MELSAEDLKRVEEMFRLYDTVGSGVVSSSTLGELLRACGEAPTEMKIEELMKQDGGNITLEDLIHAVKEVRRSCPRPTFKDLENAMLTLDKSGTGRINVADLKKMLTTQGEPLEPAQVDDVLKELEMVNGTVDCAKVAQLLSSE